MAEAEKTEKKKTLSTQGLRKMRFKHKLLLIVTSLIMIVFLRTGFVFFVIGMLPAIVAYYMDVTKHRYTFRCILFSNLSGMLPFITRVISEGPSSTLMQEIMGNSVTWITIYGAAMVGWLLILVCPMLAQAMVHGVHQTQLRRYEWLQKKLESEWGPEVMQFSGEHGQVQED